MLISDVLKGKSKQGIITVRPGLSIREAAQVLADNQIGAAVVSEDGLHLLGIINERDIVHTVANGAAALEEPLRQLMTREVITTGRGASLESVADTMTEQRVRHIPVIADGILIGVVSIGDIVKSRMEQLHSEKQHLEGYING